MKKLLLIAVLFTSCKNEIRKEKPFIITDKYHNTNNLHFYAYEDKNGQVVTFYDIKIYYIGDTIK